MVKNQGTKQRAQRILGDCWQWEANGQCVKGDNCSFRHDTKKRGKMTQPNPSPNSFMQQSERKPSRTRSPRGTSPSGRMSRWPCKDYLRGTCNNSFCERWHRPECLFYKTKSGCRFGEKCSFAHRQVDEQPTKRSKKNDNKSAVAMLKKGNWQQREPVTDQCHDRPGNLGRRVWSHAILGASVKRSDTGQGKSEEWGEGVEMIHMFCTWWKAFFYRSPDQPFHWNDSFHGYITGRRREGTLITQRAVSVRLKKEGIQYMTDFEDMSNAFACTSANCRAEVLEELINETDRPLFFERSSTPQHVTIPTRVFLCYSTVATSWFRVRGGRRCICRCCRDRHGQAWNAIWDSRLSL